MRTTPIRLRGLAAAAAALAAAATASASVRFVPVAKPDARANLDAACADAGSPACAAALEALTRAAAKILNEAAWHPNVDLRPQARLAADSADPGLRAAAAVALGTPFAEAVDTPILAELLDDAVPAVRAAAMRALGSSPDERAQRLVRRANAYGGNRGDALAAQAAVAAAKLGVKLPANSVYLHFASDPSRGIYSFHTPDPAERVLAAARSGGGDGPFTPEQFVDWSNAESEAAGNAMEEFQVEEGQMPSPEQMAKMMEMAANMGTAMAQAQAQGGSQEEVAAAAAAAAGQKAPVSLEIADPLGDAEIFGDPRLAVVPLASGARATVVVYRDLAVGGTGVTVQRPPLQ